jgi:hypothetical protein
VAFAIDKMVRQDAVRIARDTVRISWRGVNLHPFEAVAQFTAKNLEALRRAKRVTGEAQTEDLCPRAGAGPG